jgi:outer membrane protein TolC
MNSTHRRSVLLAGLLAVHGGPSSAQEAGEADVTPANSAGARVIDAGARVIDEAWVLATLKEKNPSLRAAGLELAQAREATHLEEGKFPYTFQADGSYSRLRAPQWSSDTSSSSQGDTMVLGSQLSRLFPTGTTATLRAEGQYLSSQDASALAMSGLTGGSAYQTTLRATLTQALLGGYGSTVNLASLRAARISEQKQQKNLDLRTSELLRDALLGYWEFWYAHEAVAIQADALALTKAQLREADLRVAHGQLAAADALKFRTQVASLTESLINAKAAFVTAGAQLGRLVGVVEPFAAWEPSSQPPNLRELPAVAAVLGRLRARSPVLAEPIEALRLAREKRRTSGDDYRARLDASTWVETSGVGSGRLAPALRQTGTLGTVSVFAGLTFQNTLDDQRLRAARAQASHAVALAEANLDVSTQQLESDAVQTWQKAEQASAILQAANQTVDIASQQAENERQRFSLGANTYLDVQVAEDTLRQARLRVLRAKVDRAKASIMLDHLAGELVGVGP